MTAQPITHRPTKLFRKVIDFPLTRMLLALLFVSLIVAGVQSLIVLLGTTFALKSSVPTAFLYYGLYVAVTLLAAALAYQSYVRLLEKRPVTELAFTGAWRETGIGVLIGIGLMTMTVGLL